MVVLFGKKKNKIYSVSVVMDSWKNKVAVDLCIKQMSDALISKGVAPEYYIVGNEIKLGFAKDIKKLY
jgi:hypothetical protein